MSVDEKKQYLRSGKLARLAGVSTDTLRHYERKGLLARPRRSMNNYREYPPCALDRVRIVQRALEVGFTLDELARILSVRDRGGTPCNQVRALAWKKLTQIETRLTELRVLRNQLRKLLKEWDKLLANNALSERAGLLDSLAARIPRSHPGKLQLACTPINRKKENEEVQW